jgi:hypothetical protein
MVTHETPRPTRTNGVWSVTGDVARKRSGSTPALRPELNARTEREKRAYFGALRGLDLRDTEYPRLVFGHAPKQTVRYFPDKLPIGHAEYERTHVFLYPVHSVDLVHFCLFLARHHWFLNSLPFWTIRVLCPRPIAWRAGAGHSGTGWPSGPDDDPALHAPEPGGARCCHSAPRFGKWRPQSRGAVQPWRNGGGGGKIELT